MMEIPDHKPQPQNDDACVICCAERALRTTGYPAMRSIQCDLVDDVLTLTGVVPTYYLKQLAQAAVLSIETVERVNNLVDVR